jgi:pimeloyl-ACP methyl ester carboxylesterase
MMAQRSLKTQHATVTYYEGGQGPDLVFLHDAIGVAEDSPFLAALSRRFHVYAPLLPGYGPAEEAPTIRDMLDVTLHTLDVLDALKLTRPVLVGHSLGGMIAAEMAALAPREIDRLGLIAPLGMWLDAHPVADLFTHLPYQLPALLFHDAEAGQRMLTAGSDPTAPDFLVRFLVKNARQLGMAGKFLFPVPERGLSRRLYRVTARTLLIWGQSDKVVPPVYAAAFAQALPGAERVMIPEAGHLVTWEKPEEVASAIRRLAGRGD